MKSPAKSLYIDITGEMGKVCLGNDCLVWQAQGKAELVLKKIDQLLKKHKLNLKDLDAIKTNLGPGSFTGARVAVSVVNGLNWSLGKSKIIKPVYSHSPHITKRF